MTHRTIKSRELHIFKKTMNTGKSFQEKPAWSGGHDLVMIREGKMSMGFQDSGAMEPES